ncbi:MAG TPA: hypothetical protein PLE45_05800 [Spirochaetota bacterium]|nr:hypothetical protein [Spirochaetota bacterium]HOL56795.1 hypothetical protein [Spirochaetota bacterium]HPP04262.1 hypothetical protein [Spirochaetota bacterium]
MNIYMKNNFFKIIIFLVILGCQPQLEEKEKPFLLVLNTLSENLVYLKSKDDTDFKNGIITGDAPNQIIYDNGYFFIVNSLSNSILKLDEYLNVVKEFGVLSDSNPYKAVIINEKIYITSYLLHSVMLYNHNDGKMLKSIPIESIEYGSKIYYPFPCGIVRYNNYLFVACKYTLDAGAQNALKGRVVIIDVNQNKVTGYIQSEGYNTTNIYIKNDDLYIISTGTYNNGYQEDGIIEKVNLITLNFNSVNTDTTIVANGNSFGTICFTEDFIFTGNIGNSKLIKFDNNFNQIEYKILKEDGFSFISAMRYYDKKIFLLEYNGSTLYVIDPVTFYIKKKIKTSLNQYGDAIDLVIPY